MDDAVAQCDVCKAFGKAPHPPVSGTSSVSMFNPRLQMDLLFLDDTVALHIMSVFSSYSTLTRVLTRKSGPLGGLGHLPC